MLDLRYLYVDFIHVQVKVLTIILVWMLPVVPVKLSHPLVI